MKYEIQNTVSGAVLGQYEADSAVEAIEKFSRDAGYDGAADAAKVASDDGLRAVEAED